MQSYANNTINGDIKQIKACDIMENNDRMEYLQYEVKKKIFFIRKFYFGFFK